VTDNNEDVERQLENIIRLPANRKSKRRSMEPAWFQSMVRDERGRVIANVANVLVALRYAPELETPSHLTRCSRQLC